MSAINATTVDRDLQLREKIEEISRECSEICDELLRTLDKSNRIAHIVFDASQFLKVKIAQGSMLENQNTQTMRVTPKHETDLNVYISRICQRLLQKQYLPFSRAATREDLVEAEFTFTIEFRDANDNLLKDRVWKLAR